MATSRSLALRRAGLSTTPSLVLACRCPTRSCERPLHRTALLRRDSAHVVPPFQVSPHRASTSLVLHSNHAFACQDSRNQAQNMRAVSGRVLRACRTRTSLGCSALQGLTAWTLDWISPVSPLPFLPSPRGLGWNLRVSIGPHCGCRWCARPKLRILSDFLALLGFLPSYLDLMLWKWPSAGSCFHLGARSALPPRHPLLFAESTLPA
jgi:hypothetical protein